MSQAIEDRRILADTDAIVIALSIVTGVVAFLLTPSG
jgi:hypothetical protein